MVRIMRSASRALVLLWFTLQYSLYIDRYSYFSDRSKGEPALSDVLLQDSVLVLQRGPRRDWWEE